MAPLTNSCFGMRNAPFAFHSLGKAVKEYLNQRGVRMIIYLDDILVMAQSVVQCIRHSQLVVNTLIKLGFYIKRGKCILEPSQNFFFLGYMWDTKDITCSLPREKLENIKFLARRCLATEYIPVKLLRSLSGVIMAARPAFPLTRARHRAIQA